MFKISKNFFALCGSVLIILIMLTGEVFAQSSYFFYSFSTDPWTFHRRDSDGTNPITVFNPAGSVIYQSTVDGSISKVYFYDQSGTYKIYQSDYDGLNRATLLTPTPRIAALAAGNGYLFYSYGDDPWSVRRINSSGTGDTQIYLNPAYGIVQKIAFDAANNYFYLGLRVNVWVILYLLEHTGKDFQSEIFLVA